MRNLCQPNVGAAAANATAAGPMVSSNVYSLAPLLQRRTHKAGIPQVSPSGPTCG